jgi:nicotinate-nucleotide adenylyltransferase
MSKAETNPITAAERVAIFGGTFNPLHAGHINAISTIKGRLNLDRVVVVPAAQNPHRPAIEGPSNEDRLGMLKVGLEEMSEFVLIDEQELNRKGPSYSIETLEEYAKVVPPESLYLVIGMDQFLKFDTWKDYQRILTIANLAVVTRPGYSAPFAVDDLPEGLQPLVAAFDRQFIALHSDRNIEIIRLQDIDASATEVRKRLLTGRSVDRLLTLPVEDYIRTHQLYAPLAEKIGDTDVFVRFCTQALFAKKAVNVRAFDLRDIDAPTEYTVVASGTSTRHASSLAESVSRAVKEEYNVFPQSVEGLQEGRWVLLDYGSLIVHVFYDYVRQEYQIEDLWKSGKDLVFKDEN